MARRPPPNGECEVCKADRGRPGKGLCERCRVRIEVKRDLEAYGGAGALGGNHANASTYLRASYAWRHADLDRFGPLWCFAPPRRDGRTQDEVRELLIVDARLEQAGQERLMTDRQADVARRYWLGEEDKADIAGALGLSRATVNTHLAAVADLLRR